MTHVRPSHLTMVLAILAGMLIAEPASACTPGVPCGGMSPPPTPSVRPSPPPTPPNVSGAVNGAVNAGQNAVSAATKEARDQLRRQRAAKARDRQNATDVKEDLGLLVGGALNESWKRGDFGGSRR
jgi:hypothetical protein